MAHRINKPAKNKNDRIFKWTSLILAGLGTVDALYLLILKYTQSEAMCVGNHGCITVNNSIYSTIYGIPVSVFGIAAYLAMIAILLLEQRMRIARENGRLAVLGISLIGVFFSAYLTYLELYVIHALCPFCVASAVLVTLIFILAIIRLINQTAH